MNEKKIEKRIREAIQGVWVLESKKMSDGRILKQPRSIDKGVLHNDSSKN